MKTYLPEIVKNAEKFGYKAANLMFLQSQIEEFKKENPSDNVVDLAIPDILPIENDLIMTHLRGNIENFDEKWNAFCEELGAEKSFSPAASNILSSLQSEIIECFKNHKFEPDRLPDHHKFMVRSSGEEDRVDLANPGGNESIASLPENISQSIGTVIASYISKKSLLQRLKSGEDITDHFPLSPCLIQVMIEGKEYNEPSISGVIYTDNGHVRIQSAPGHGELIVNSLGNFDNYYITPKNKVYAEVRDKHIRLTPVLNQKTGKMEQITDNNNFQLATNPSLDEETLLYLHRLANFIEKKYGMRMDIEFVYDYASKTANIVQARPIPEGDRRGIRPSALSNEFISRQNPQNIKASVITPDINFASVIRSLENILISDTIEQAHDIYIKDNRNISTVIIKKAAPDTSHQAGLFISKAITVFQIDDLEEVKKWTENLQNEVLISDPQHKKLYKIPKSEFVEELIQEGIFASTLSSHVTPFKREFKNKQLVEEMFGIMQTESVTRYTKKLLDTNLDNLSLPKFGEEAEQQKTILANLLQFSYRMQNKGRVSADLFKEIMLTGHELHQLLSTMKIEDYDEDKSKYYLNVFRKFEGLVTSQRKKDVISSSILSEMHASKSSKHYLKIVSDMESRSNRHLTSTQKDLFLELVTSDRFIIDPKNRIKWQTFCFNCCSSDEQALKLAYLTKKLYQNDLQGYWLNSIFLSQYNNTLWGNTLNNLYDEFNNGKEQRERLLEANKIISQMEHQIPEWSNPEKFESLHNNLSKNAKILENFLSIDSEEKLYLVMMDKLNTALLTKLLNKYIEAFDLSIKELQTSHLYPADNLQKTTNFIKLVKEFHQLMEKTSLIYPKDKLSDKRRKCLNSIKEFIESSKIQNSAINELEISSNFSLEDMSLSQAKIPCLYKEDEPNCFIKKNTFADAHTLIHQILLHSVMSHNANSKELIQNSPNIIKKIDRMIRAYRKPTTKKIANNDTPPPSLASVDYNHPEFKLRYYIPLRGHSAAIDIIYNINKDEIGLDFFLYGINEQPGGSAYSTAPKGRLGRWDVLGEQGLGLNERYTHNRLVSFIASKNSLNLQIKKPNGLEGIEDALTIFYGMCKQTFHEDFPIDGRSVIEDLLQRKFLKYKFTKPSTEEIGEFRAEILANKGRTIEDAIKDRDASLLKKLMRQEKVTKIDDDMFNLFMEDTEPKFRRSHEWIKEACQILLSCELEDKQLKEIIYNVFRSGLYQYQSLSSPILGDKKINELLNRNLEVWKNIHNATINFEEQDKEFICRFVNFNNLLNICKDDPVSFIEEVGNLKKEGHDFKKGEDNIFRDINIKALWSDREKIEDFLNQNSTKNPQYSNLEAIIVKGSQEQLKTALEFKTSITANERKLIEKKFPEKSKELLEKHAASPKTWVEFINRNLGIVKIIK